MNTRPYLQSKPAIVVAIVVATLLSIIAAAATFSIARGTQQVANEGTTGILAEAALSAAAATHNATVQAHLAAEAAQLDLLTQKELDTALETAEEAVAELRSRTQRLAGDLANPSAASQIETEVDALVTGADRALAAIRAGDAEISLQAVEDDLGPAYDQLVTTLADTRNRAFEQMAVAQDDAGRLADAARFLVVLLVPIAVLVAYRNWIRREQTRHQLENELEKEQAISQTKSDFIAHLSHELRTPLTSIYGSALELNEMRTSQDTELRSELTKLITEESADLARMVEDILTVAAEDQNQLTIVAQTINPATEVAAALEPFEMIGLITDRQVAAAGVEADPRLFRQVISNLVSNAHRHGRPPVSVHGQIVGMDYVIRVVDHGDGIFLEDGEELFTRFVHKDDSPLITGTLGLGLSVVQILATRMGGTIKYGRSGETSEFTVSLPLASLPR